MHGSPHTVYFRSTVDPVYNLNQHTTIRSIFQIPLHTTKNEVVEHAESGSGGVGRHKNRTRRPIGNILPNLGGILAPAPKVKHNKLYS